MIRLVPLIVVALQFAAMPAHAQPAEADTTATTPLQSLSSIASQADSLAAARGDSLVRIAKPVPVDRWAPLRPTVKASVTSNVSQVQVSGTVSAPVFELFADRGSIQYNETRTNYRQFDREQEDRRLTGNLTDEIGPSIDLKLDFLRNTNFDENRPSVGDPIILDYAANEANLKFNGDHELNDGFSHHWVMSSAVEDVDQTNRNVDNDRSLASLGLTSVWKRDGTAFDLTGRYGYRRSTGERQVRGLTDDASVEVDTLAVQTLVEGIPRTRITLDARRATFYEERLDFARNANGAIDTLNVAVPVGQERETRTLEDVRASGSVRPIRWLELKSSTGIQFTETEYRFSQQGIVQRGREDFDASVTFRYAEAGSLQVRYDYGNNYNDRRVRGDELFRGRESTLSNEVGMTVRQGMFGASDLEFDASQQLTQIIFDERGNNNDRDRLVESFRLGIDSDALPHTTLQLGGTARRTLDLNIAADRVGNNNEERLYEVTGSYTYDPPGGFRFAQTYRLQIVFRDLLDGIDRDSFNKQGQVSTRLNYDFPGKGALGLEYVSDYRSTGSRDPDSLVRETYVTDSIRNDRRLVANAQLPLGPITLSAGAERGFLDQDQRGNESSEERGRLNLRASGTRTFLAGALVLNLDVERVRQFGPRVREEQADYWVANSSVTLEF